MTPARPATLAIVAGVLLGAATDCRCVEHPLYDARTNRFDSFYLGGGDSQYRPFRDVRYEPGAEFVVEVRRREHHDEPDQLLLAAKLEGRAAADIEADVVALWPGGAPPVEEVLANFDHVDDDLVLAHLDREDVRALRNRGGRLSLRFCDGTTLRATLELMPDDLLEPPSGSQPTRETP